MDLYTNISYGDTVKVDGVLVKIIHVERNWWNNPPTISTIDVRYENGIKETIVYWEFSRLSDYREHID